MPSMFSRRQGSVRTPVSSEEAQSLPLYTGKRKILTGYQAGRPEHILQCHSRSRLCLPSNCEVLLLRGRRSSATISYDLSRTSRKYSNEANGEEGINVFGRKQWKWTPGSTESQ